MSSEAPDI